MGRAARGFPSFWAAEPQLYRHLVNDIYYISHLLYKPEKRGKGVNFILFFSSLIFYCKEVSLL
jgi:hypothetical protein